MSDAKVNLWGSTIGAVSWLDDRRVGIFQYAPDFLASGVELAPLTMPLREFPYEFPELGRETFKGLPGLLADSLPDRFGNAIIDEWLASEGRTRESFNPVQRLCYVGKRGMGALEFEPAYSEISNEANRLDVARLARLANRILKERSQLKGAFSGVDDRETINSIIRVGTSAGGARAKAILAWNPETDEFRSGQIEAESGFEYWLMKFDGISSDHETEIDTPMGFGRIEYAYYLMAVEAGIEMNPCRLHHEGGRSHFMTRRFDRVEKGDKLHMQTLGAMAHYDYNQPASYSYEQAIQVIRQLDLSREDKIQQLLRAIFNVIGRNCDDHVKNIAFLMNRQGDWKLSPAYDVSYSWNPSSGSWTANHQMSVNGKRDGFEREDLVALANLAGIKRIKANQMVDHVIETIRRWPVFAESAGVEEFRMQEIQRNLRLNLQG